MASQTYHLIKDLNVKRENFVLKLRVLRVWRRTDNRDKTKPYSIEMVMSDEEGERVQSNCLAKWFSRFESFFNEGEVLVIRKPTLGDNRGNFKVIRNPIKVCMNTNTEIERCESWNGPLHVFEFADFDNIIEKEIDKTVSIDIIGVINGSNPPKNFGDNGEKIRINFSIQDIQGRVIWLTLFGEYAERLIAYYKPHKDKQIQVVILLQFAQFGIYKNNHSICNYFDVSKLFINDDIDVIVQFKNSFNEVRRETPSSSVSRLSSTIAYNLEDDFLVDTEFNHIAELNVINEAKKVVILGTIKCFLEGSNWFYHYCKVCNKIVDRFLKDDATTTSGDMWYYKHKVPKECQDDNIVPSTRLKLLIKVQDSTGSVILTLFELELRKILKVTAAELLSKDFEVGKYPLELEGIFERRLAMKVDINSFNIEHDYRYFTIESITDSKQVISVLDERHNKEENVFSQSLDISSQGPGDNESGVNKEVIDLSDMKSQNQKALKGKGKFEHDHELKRKLNDIYDVEDGAGSSPVKSAAESAGGTQSSFEHELLVPKVEK